MENVLDLLDDAKKRRDGAKHAFDKCTNDLHKNMLWGKYVAFSHVVRRLQNILNSENDTGVSNA